MNDTSELREQIVKDIVTAAEWREHIGATFGQSINPDRIDSRRKGSEKVADLILEKVEAYCAQREQAAERRGRIDELKDVRPGKYSDVMHLRQVIDNRLAELEQATKPEKGTEE